MPTRVRVLLGLFLVIVLALGSINPAQAEVATFYSDSYAGGLTASGATYDPNGWTAAMGDPSMLGAVVDVCDVDSCIYGVTVTDTCACGIDLSRAAASGLFPMAQGTAAVTVTPS